MRRSQVKAGAVLGASSALATMARPCRVLAGPLILAGALPRGGHEQLASDSSLCLLLVKLSTTPGGPGPTAAAVPLPADAGIDGRRGPDALRHLVPTRRCLAGLPTPSGVRAVVARPSSRARRATGGPPGLGLGLQATTKAGGEAAAVVGAVAAPALALLAVLAPSGDLGRAVRLVQRPGRVPSALRPTAPVAPSAPPAIRPVRVHSGLSRPVLPGRRLLRRLDVIWPRSKKLEAGPKNIYRH